MPAPSAARPPFLSPQQQRFTLVGEERLFHQSLFFFFLFAAAPPWRKQVEGRGGVSQLDLLPFCGGFSSYTSLGYLISDFFGTHDNHRIESWMLMFSYLKIFFAHLNFVRLLICQKRPFAPPQCGVCGFWKPSCQSAPLKRDGPSCCCSPFIPLLNTIDFLSVGAEGQPHHLLERLDHLGGGLFCLNFLQCSSPAAGTPKAPRPRRGGTKKEDSKHSPQERGLRFTFCY